jgi:hypothetical protein
MGHRRAPAVQHGGETDAGAEVVGIGGDGGERLSRRLEQDVVYRGLVVVGDVGDRGREGEHHVVVGDRQQLGLAFGQPFLGGEALALWTMAVAAGVVGDERVPALLAARDMPAESRRAAALDGRHDFQLAEADVAGVGATPSRPVGAEDIRDLDGGRGKASHVLRRRPHPRDEMFERAGDLTERLEGDARIERGGIELLVPEQHLDYANVGLLLQQMRGEAVPQRVQ